jgi:hypothetical protein
MLHSPEGKPGERLRASLKRQELLSALGVLALGLGVGSLLSSYLRSAAPALAVIDAGAHGWSMYRPRHLEQSSPRRSVWWMEALYWGCWLLLARRAPWLAGKT